MPGSTEGPITTKREGNVLVLTLARPEQRNALSRPLRAELAAALEDARHDPSVRALVITGAGTAFCAGLDLGELEGTLAMDEAAHHADSEALAELFLSLLAFPKPVVAAVNGPAVAGGAGLVSACDLAVMAESARIGYTEARIGFVAALVGVLLMRQVGEKHARDLLLSARLVDASEAHRMGLVNEVVADEHVLKSAMARAAALARNAPGSLALTKRLFLEASGMRLSDAMRRAVELNVKARVGDELAEGVRAFLEKREPAWRE
ncbi:MAG: enoyl-CoA hydratase/isomerase family protein [Truepera sp.]|jgi:methylglutaconyl-CoA hydratase|nr:enoyl-CoA hydratase/isomerase family protein [Truepera sp.]